MSRSLRILAAAAIASVTVAAIGAGSALAATPLTGTVGTRANAEAFVITLTRAGRKVTTVTAGTYQIKINDLAATHNFHLTGPGLNKLTSVLKKGVVTWTVKLQKGKIYRFVCDPHRTIMKGSFRVV